MSTVKKGRKSWKPANLLEVKDKDPKFTYRWINNDPANVQKKKMEGWEIVQGRTKQVKHDHPENIQDGKPLDTITSYREMILAKLPIEDKESRAEYYQERTRASTLGLVQEAKGQAEAAGGSRDTIKGTITIE
jgi:hypothetical protein